MRQTSPGPIFRLWFALTIAAALPPASAWAESSAPPNDKDVEALVHKLQARLLEMQVDKWALTTSGPDQPMHPLGFPLDPHPVFGRLVEKSLAGITFESADGKQQVIPMKQVYSLQAPGHFQPDYYMMSNPGGYSWMAYWALVASGMDRGDPRMQKAMRAMVESAAPAGIYSLSLRMNACSLLIRERSAQPDPTIQKTLADDTTAMLRAMLMRGDYTYRVSGNAPRGDGDNSNTQFAVYAVWAAAMAGNTIPGSYWNTVGKFWVETQLPEGGWGYSRGLPTEGPSMTEAGLNTLYILMDQLWGRQEGTSYSTAEGLRYRPDIATRIRNVRERMDRAWKRVEASLPAAGQETPPYRLYGLQRLGIASGRKRIGTEDWFQRITRELYHDGAVQPQETIEQISWRLLCLSFGRRPVLFNKLQTDDDESHWNYYIRDVANLTQWINRATERVHNWQIVSLKNELRDLEDAPILIICGELPLTISDEEGAKLKRYCDLGGTVFVNPVHNSAQFKQSVMKLFSKLYPDSALRRVPEDHPIYIAAQGARGGRVPRLALRAISDGARDFVFIADGDAAGAWQLRSGGGRQDARLDEGLHQMMLNLRLYAAPSEYSELVGPLRQAPPPNPRNGAVVRVARLKHQGHSQANPLLYEAIDPYLAAQKQYLDARFEVAASDDQLKDVDVIHVTGQVRYSFAPPELEAIKNALRRGAFLIVDPAYGQADTALAGREFAEQLGLTANPLSLNTHALVQFLTVTDFNEWTGPEKMRAFNELRLDGKVVGFLSNVDITAAATGDHVYGNPGIWTKAARQLWVNLIAQSKGILPPATAPATAPAAPASAP